MTNRLTTERLGHIDALHHADAMVCDLCAEVRALLRERDEAVSACAAIAVKGAK